MRMLNVHVYLCAGVVQTACYFVRMCNGRSDILQYSSETLRKIGVNWLKPPKRVVRKSFILYPNLEVDVTNILFILQQCVVIQLQLSTQP